MKASRVRSVSFGGVGGVVGGRVGVQLQQLGVGVADFPCGRGFANFRELCN